MTLQKYKNKKLQDPEFGKAYEEVQPEMKVVRAIIEARTSQNLTQKEPQKTGRNLRILRTERSLRQDLHQGS